MTVKDLKGDTWEDQLRSFDLFSLEKRKLIGGIIAAYQVLKEDSKGEVADPSRIKQHDTWEWFKTISGTGSQSILGNTFLLREWTNTRIGFLGRCLSVP